MQFSQVIGQQRLKEQLRKGVAANRVSHAQLFTGRAGYGSLTLAIAYVQYLNCPHRTAEDSCGVCPSCQQIASLSHPDLHFVMPVNKQGKKSGEVVMSDEFMPLFREVYKNHKGYFSAAQWYESLNLGKTLKGVISAKEADTIIRKLSYKSFGAEYKCMIIWLPEMMNEQAANKILKILEEPWDKTLFILISERPEQLLQTILSRTQEVAVPRLEQSDGEEYALTLGVANTEQAQKMTHLSGGDLIELRRMVSGSAESSSDSFERFAQLMRFSYNDKHLELMTWAEEVAQLPREQQRTLLLESARLLREAYVRHAGLEKISYLWGEEEKFCNKFAPFIGSQNIEFLIMEIESALAQISQNGSSIIIFTHFALSVSKKINRLKQ